MELSELELTKISELPVADLLESSNFVIVNCGDRTMITTLEDITEFVNANISTDIRELEERVNSLTESMQLIASSLANANTKITANETAINTANTKIAANETAINTANTKIAANEAAINTANTNIATNTSDIANANTKIAANTSDIANANTKIAANKTSINTANTKIAANETAINTANTKIAANETAINNNKMTLVNTNTVTVSVNANSGNYKDFTVTNGSRIHSVTIVSDSWEVDCGVQEISNTMVRVHLYNPTSSAITLHLMLKLCYKAS